MIPLKRPSGALKLALHAFRKPFRRYALRHPARRRRLASFAPAAIEGLECRLLLSVQPVAAFDFTGTGYTLGTDIAVDPQDNVYILGTLDGTADFDLGKGAASGVGTSVTTEIFSSFVAKYDTAGVLQWVTTFGDGTHVDNGARDTMEVDSQGNVYITGRFANPIQLGEFTLTPQETTDLFAAKIGSSGTFQWAISRSFNVGRDGTSYDAGFAVAVDDAQSAVYIGGASSAEMVFMRLDTETGDEVWTRFSQHTDIAIGGTVNTLDTDALGNIYAGGAYIAETQLGPHVLTESKPDKGLLLEDAYVTKLTPNGNFEWAKSIQGIGRERVEALEVRDASVYLGGAFGGDQTVTRTYQRTATFGTLELQSTGEFDAFVGEMTTAGDFAWVKGFGGATGAEAVKDLLVLDNGELFLSGTFDSDSADLDPSETESHVVLQNGNEVDVFISHLTSTGNFLNGWRLGGESIDRSGGLAVASDGTIYANGLVRATADLPTGDLFVGTTAYLLTFADIPPEPGPPSIGSLSATPNPVSHGDSLTLEANSVEDDTQVVQVAFYLDTNGNGILDENDLLVATDTDGSDGWSILLDVIAADFPAGDYTFFAQATDDLDNVSDAVSVSVTIEESQSKGGGNGGGKGGGKPK